jgi:hypothetical protein
LVNLSGFMFFPQPVDDQDQDFQSIIAIQPVHVGLHQAAFMKYLNYVSDQERPHNQALEDRISRQLTESDQGLHLD